MSAFALRPFTPALGAEVTGLDLSRPLDDATFERIREAWHRHLVLVFRDQRLSDAQLERFSARFGPLDRKPLYSDEVVDTTTSDFVCVISNVKVDGKPIGDLGDGEAVWHTDMSYNALPPMAAALYALEIPPRGRRNRIRQHVSRLRDLAGCAQGASAGCAASTMRRATAPATCGAACSPSMIRSTSPGTAHPMVRTHPETGRDALYLGRRRHAYVIGLPLAESERLLDDVWDHATRPQFAWHHTLAARRPAALGQPLRHASAQWLRSGRTPRHASHADPGRRAVSSRARLKSALGGPCPPFRTAANQL